MHWKCKDCRLDVFLQGIQYLLDPLKAYKHTSWSKSVYISNKTPVGWSTHFIAVCNFNLPCQKWCFRSSTHSCTWLPKLYGGTGGNFYYAWDLMCLNKELINNHVRMSKLNICLRLLCVEEILLNRIIELCLDIWDSLNSFTVEDFTHLFAQVWLTTKVPSENIIKKIFCF